jgi:uncharacterized protein involved in outer membrane biogenesis
MLFFKAQIASAVTDATGRELVIKGDLDWSVSLIPKVIAHDVTFPNAAWGSRPEMLKIDMLEVKVSLIPLMLGRLEIGQINLIGVDLLIEIDAKGNGNWEVPTTDKSGIDLRRLALGKLHIKDLALSYRNNQENSTSAIHLNQLSAVSSIIGHRISLQLEGTVAGQPIQASATLGSLQSMVSHSVVPIDAVLDLARINFTISGELGDLRTPSAVNLTIVGSGQNLNELRSLTEWPLPTTDEFKVTGHLYGSMRSIAFDEILATMAHHELQLELRGAIADLVSLTGIDLKVEAMGADLANLNPYTGATFPETDSFTLMGTLRGPKGSLAFNNINASIGAGDLKLAMEGKIGNLNAGSGVDLRLSVSGEDLAYLGSLVGSRLPETGAFDISTRISGTRESIALHDLSATVRKDSLRLRLHGSVGDVLTIHGVDMKVSASGSDIADLGPLIGSQLPKSDSFTIDGRLRGSDKDFALTNLEADIEQGELRFKLDGQISDVTAVAGVDLRVKVRGPDLARLGSLTGVKLPHTGPFKTKGRVSGSKNAMAMHRFIANIPHNSLQLSIDGRIDEPATLGGVDLKVTASGRNLAKLAAMNSIDFPYTGAFQITGLLAGSNEHLTLHDFRADFDGDDIKGSVQIGLGDRPRVAAALTSSRFDLTPWLVGKRGSALLMNSDTSSGSTSPVRLLSSNTLNSMNADITLDIDRLHFNHDTLKAVGAHITLANRILTVSDLGMNYKDASASGHFSLNAKATPVVTLRLLTQKFDLGSFLKSINVTEKLEGQIDLGIEVNSTGDSIDALMAGLNGNLSLVMSDGLVRDTDLNEVSINILKQLMPWAKNKKEISIECGLIRFDIADGYAKSKAILIDAKHMTLKGKGKIDLGTQTIDLRLVPRPKQLSALKINTNLRVRGPLRNPRISTDKFSPVTNLVGNVITDVVALTPARILPPFSKLVAERERECIDDLDETLRYNHRDQPTSHATN